MEEVEIKAEPKRLKKIDALNDYIVIWLSQLEINGVELPDETKAKMRNEGIVIGVGPDVNKGQYHDYNGTSNQINLGDRIVVRSNKYQMINPQSGVYAGEEIILVHKLDMVYRHSKHDPAKFLFLDVWSAEDSTQVMKENI